MKSSCRLLYILSNPVLVDTDKIWLLLCDERITACGTLVNIMKPNVRRGMDFIALYTADAQDAL